jgi:large subunit ribosomal protein L15
MQFHEIKRKHSNRQSKRVGRGGKRGTTSGRGTKGQKARAGRKIRPEIRDTIKKIPKLRGRGIHQLKRYHPKPYLVNLSEIASRYKAGEVVNPATLFAKGLIRRRAGHLPEVKILNGKKHSKPGGENNLLTAITVKNCQVSATARRLIEGAGGSLS